MERGHFGTYLRKHREACGLTLRDLSLTTKVRESGLALLEEAQLAALPARVFVVGWIAAYAHAVGCDLGEAMPLWRDASEPETTDLSACVNEPVVRAPEGHEPPARRYVSLGLTVIVLLTVVAMAISVMLGHDGPISAALS